MSLVVSPITPSTAGHTTGTFVIKPWLLAVVLSACSERCVRCNNSSSCEACSRGFYLEETRTRCKGTGVASILLHTGCVVRHVLVRSLRQLCDADPQCRGVTHERVQCETGLVVVLLFCFWFLSGCPALVRCCVPVKFLMLFNGFDCWFIGCATQECCQ